MVFDKVEVDWDQEAFQIKLRLCFWMKGWESECPYNPSQLVSNLHEVCSGRKVPKPREIVPLQPPPHRSWKWNVDGSAKGKPGPTGIGGVLQNDKGCILTKFAASVGLRDLNEAEFLAIVFALEISVEKEWLKQGILVIESHSKVALAWV